MRGAQRGGRGGSRPSHFICLPLQNGSVPERASKWATAALQLDPLPKGLDASIVIAPKRLHLTLGVMNLQSNIGSSDTRSVTNALAVLHDCQQEIGLILGERRLQICMSSLGMFPELNSPSACRVLYAIPTDVPGNEGVLRAIGGL